MSTACLAEENDNSKATPLRYLKTATVAALCVAQTCVFAKMAHHTYEAYKREKSNNQQTRANFSLVLGGVACSALGYGIHRSAIAAHNAFSNINKKQNKAEQKPVQNESRIKNGARAFFEGTCCLISALGCAAGCVSIHNLIKKNITSDDEFTREYALTFPTFAYCTYEAGSSCVESLKKVFASKKPGAARA